MKNLKQEVDAREKTTFSGPEIQSHIPNSKWILYSKLQGVENIASFMEGKRNLLILLDPPNESIGHFVLLIFKSNNYACFFDPYGNSLKKLLLILGLNTHLLDLLKGYRVEENHERYEKSAKKIQTCGRMCLMRGLNSEMTNEEFRNYFHFRNIHLDELVTLTTQFILKK